MKDSTIPKGTRRCRYCGTLVSVADDSLTIHEHFCRIENAINDQMTPEQMRRAIRRIKTPRRRNLYSPESPMVVA
jgi:hypothetical protein